MSPDVWVPVAAPIIGAALLFGLVVLLTKWK